MLRYKEHTFGVISDTHRRALTKYLLKNYETFILIWIIVIVVIVLVGGIWYWASSMGTQSAGNESTGTNAGATNNAGTAATAPNPPATASTSMLVILNTESTGTLGSYLATTDGMTLYESTNDRTGVSNCTGACATAWPPYTVSATEAKSVLGGTLGITGKVGTIARANGTIQVTYNGMPLYLYEKDQVIGDAMGRNVGGFVIVKP